ncbi:hypothetical protein OAF63_00585 [Saprospiraceae bacterium]|jgi:uncharacterized protein YifE (UPF0438 family)|nr:hypothetical protein [Saprospiraceae bacterium]
MKTAYELLSLTKSHLVRKINLPMEATTIETIIQPETEIEKKILEDTTFRKGLMWGQPRYGHPEGKILFHIHDIFENIEKLKVDGETRRKLRLIALVHDTFKFDEHKGYPRDWSKHHSILARQFFESYSSEKDILDIIELHDEAYYSWRMIALYGREEEGEKRLEKLLYKLGDNLQLYYLFFKCDTQTGDKIQAPLKWFEETIQGIEIIL